MRGIDEECCEILGDIGLVEAWVAVGYLVKLRDDGFLDARVAVANSSHCCTSTSSLDDKRPRAVALRMEHDNVIRTSQ